jgi:lipopolysaccharide export system protein LptA
MRSAGAIPGSAADSLARAGSTQGARADTSGRAAVAAKAAKESTVKAGGPEVTVKSSAPAKAEPLIMENADRMEGFRSRGEYVLVGKVRFVHGDLRIETERAVWLKERSLVYAESGMRITQGGAVLTAERGNYDKNQGLAVAEGKVHIRDTSADVEAFGQTLHYNRNRHLATLSGNPELRRYYRKQPDSAAAGDSVKPVPRAAPAPAPSPKAAAPAKKAVAKPAGDTLPITDTLVIRGRTLTYNDSAQIAAAEGKVNITRDEVVITCEKAEYHDRPDSLYLLGSPQVMLDESRIKGLTMRLGMQGEEIRSLLVKGEAEARSVEPATDSSSARHSDVAGDSLFLAFRKKSIDSVQVFRNAKGSYFDVDRPDFVNRMSGEYMVLRFNGKQVASANVTGGSGASAKSTYFHLEKKAFKGKNEAEGDTIDFAFKDGKVEEVMVRGSAKGTYFGEPQARKSKPAAGDSTAPSDTAVPDAPRAPGASGAAPRDPDALPSALGAAGVPAGGGSAEKTGWPAGTDRAVVSTGLKRRK